MVFREPAMHCVACGETHPRRSELQPSPFHSLMVQDKIPNASETAAIRDFIVDIDAEVAWREEAINRFRCEVAELRRRSDHHKAIIAPIRRLPPETIAEIFLHLTAMEETLKETMKQQRNESPYSPTPHYLVRPLIHRAPLLFCEVSRKWRAIAQSIPRLWSSLSLRCRNKEFATGVLLCETWLKRSGSLPLSIRLYPRCYPFAQNRYHSSLEDSDDLVKTILPFAARWRALELDGLSASSYNSLRHVFSDPVPMLETLSISHGWQSAFSESSIWEGVRIDAPKLRCLRFDKVGSARITTQNEQATFPWSQLTHMNLADCSADDCLRILSQASAAVNCRFYFTRSSSPLVQHAPVLLSELQTLQIHINDGVDLGQWWNFLTCPALSSLFVGSDTSQTLPSFITRTGKTIEDFSLFNSGLDDDQILACLADMPSLRRLKFSETGQHIQLTDEFWECLTWTAAKNSPTPLIPNLELLDVTGGVHYSHKCIVRMLKSRLRRAAPELKAVKLLFRRNLSSSAYFKLLAFAELGLKMTVQHSEFQDEDDEDGSEASDTEDEAGGDSGELEDL